MELSDVDLLEDTWSNQVPHAMFELLRHQAPVFWHEEVAKEGPGFFAITKHADIRDLSRDVETWSSELGGTFIPDATPEALAQLRLTILNMDPPKHHQNRRLVSRGFTPRMIRKLDEQVAARAKTIVDTVIDKGEIDFVDAVAVEMPAQLICDMLGVPEGDRAEVVAWSNTMVGFDDPFWRNTQEDAELAAANIFMYCDALVEERRKHPQDDIVTVLIEAEIEGERLTKEDLNMFFVTLVVAGNETTRNLISHSLIALAERPEVVSELREDESLWPGAVEEMLRWGTSIHNFRRTATHDTEVRGVPIKAGQKAVLYYMSGNHDEEVFDDPYTFDIRRSPNDHLTFGGGGTHFCLGAGLARSEIRHMLQEFFTRIDNVELTEEPMRMRSDFINGINRMPIRFQPRS